MIPTELLAALELALLWGCAHLGGVASREAVPLCRSALRRLRPVPAKAAGAPSAANLPPLLGMLLVGLAFRSLWHGNLVADIPAALSAACRKIALTVILCRAGLGLDVDKLRSKGLPTLRLSAVPCLLETVTSALVSKHLLGLSYPFAFTLGFVLAAVSPAVVVPGMLGLNDAGYGVDKGVPTMVLAAASLDDVLAMCGFGACMGVAFDPDPDGASLAVSLLSVPAQLFGGSCLGLLAGRALVRAFRGRTAEPRRQTAALLALALAVVFVTAHLRISASGYLFAMTCSCVAARGRDPAGAGFGKAAVSALLNAIWAKLQPLLFGLIGASVQMDALTGGGTVGANFGVLFSGLAVRLPATYGAVYGAGLLPREKLFVAMAWLPKATVQAAVGAEVLDTARALGSSPAVVQAGERILALAVLAIVITAPIGAIAIAIAGPRLLDKAAAAGHEHDREVEGAILEMGAIKIGGDVGAVAAVEAGALHAARA